MHGVGGGANVRLSESGELLALGERVNGASERMGQMREFYFTVYGEHTYAFVK